MKFILFILLTSFCFTGCIEKKVRDLESPCAATAVGDIRAQDPCIKRPVNIGII